MKSIIFYYNEVTGEVRKESYENVVDALNYATPNENEIVLNSINIDMEENASLKEKVYDLRNEKESLVKQMHSMSLKDNAYYKAIDILCDQFASGFDKFKFIFQAAKSDPETFVNNWQIANNDD